MRMTVTLDEDVYKALTTFRQEHDLGTSAALNELARRGLAAPTSDTPSRFTQRTSPMGAPRVPRDNIAEALELLEGETHR